MGQNSTTALYIQIAESIRRRVLYGRLEPGERIAPIREVAQEWNCTPGTVSRAYKLLSREGILISRPGQGTMVAGGASTGQRASWGWAALVNRAEGFLLEAVKEGYSLPDGEVAVSLAAARLRENLEHDRTGTSTSQPSARMGLRFGGSHDLLVEVLAHILRDSASSFALEVNYHGSLGGLFALARGEIDLCGIHLWDQATDTYNTPFVNHILPNREVVLLTLAHRQLGLMLPPGNPHQIRSLADLAQMEGRFVNRQPGAGTRVWLDAQLLAHGLTPADIAGYSDVTVSHTAVAGAVAQGEASAGLGIYAAAASFGLDFVPLAREQYELLFPLELAENEQIQALIEIVRSKQLQETINLLGGYDDSQTGSIRRLPE